VAISASGPVRTIHAADSVDISTFAPAVDRPPEAQIVAHIDRVRHRFDHLDSHRRSEDGTTSPLSPELTEPSVAVDGKWPLTGYSRPDADPIDNPGRPPRGVIDTRSGK
jgi:hypothetical protein